MATLYCLVGIPASGKSTFAKEHISENTIWISSDGIRKEVYGAETHQANNVEVFEMMYKRTKEALNSGINVIYDATNISLKRRRGLINQFASARKVCVYFATDLNEVLERNENRERKVPVNVIIDEMYKDLQVPMYFEGWDEIRIIRDESKKEKKQEIDLKERYLDLSIKDYESILRKIDEKNIEMPQDNSHHTLSVSRHMYFAYDYIKEHTEDRNLIIASLMHDVGKAFCKTFYEDSRYASFKKHENVSAELAINYLFDNGFEQEDIIDIATLVQLHMVILRNENGEEGIEKLKDKLGIELFNRIQLLHDADTQAK